MITRKCAISLASYAVFSAIMLIALHFMSLFTVNKWLGVIIASCIFVVTLLSLFARKYFAVRVGAFTLNAIACGVASSSLFVWLGEYPAIWQTALLWVALCALFVLYLLLSNLSLLKNHPVLAITIFVVLLLGGVIAGAVFDIKVFQLALLVLIVFTAILASCAIKATDTETHFKNIVYCTYAGVFIVILAVLLFISEGDIADGLCAPDPVASSKKKKGNPYDFIA